MRTFYAILAEDLERLHREVERRGDAPILASSLRFALLLARANATENNAAVAIEMDQLARDLGVKGAAS